MKGLRRINPAKCMFQSCVDYFRYVCYTEMTMMCSLVSLLVVPTFRVIMSTAVSIVVNRWLDSYAALVRSIL